MLQGLIIPYYISVVFQGSCAIPVVLHTVCCCCLNFQREKKKIRYSQNNLLEVPTWTVGDAVVIAVSSTDSWLKPNNLLLSYSSGVLIWGPSIWLQSDSSWGWSNPKLSPLRTRAAEVARRVSGWFVIDLSQEPPQVETWDLLIDCRLKGVRLLFFGGRLTAPE